jgi:predicted DNA-binding transcriptional regulator AlpA
MKPALQRVVLPKQLDAYGAPKRTVRDALMKQGLFPRPIRLSERRFAWLEEELIAWQQSKIRERDGGK